MHVGQIVISRLSRQTIRVTTITSSVLIIIIHGDAEELERFWKTLALREKGMEYVEGILQMMTSISPFGPVGCGRPRMGASCQRHATAHNHEYKPVWPSGLWATSDGGKLSKACNRTQPFIESYRPSFCKF
eukprot:CAMPEP_0198229442 /NCGR_PEP_ID=MMETSP1445-20131203/114126_1 /TAXON_ID=36898 /ORGANISM="Pyramimonas sp., Strain CCMP2087" /LENGTH=130 /DNA_ID=CAMNT_0043909905 /DNA_START=131 /DNA_END=523 /DNA_ORIENTATION=+